MMRTSYDPEADAYYLRFAPDGVPIAETREVAPGLMLDIDAAGDVVGIEVLRVAHLMRERLERPAAAE